MALRVCDGCSTTFAVGLAGCPHCGSTDHHEEGSMPKITRHGGPSIAGEAGPELVDLPAGSRVAPVATEPGCQHPDCVLDHPHAGPAVLSEPDEGGAPSPGSSSSASSPKPTTTGGQSKTSRPLPARTTENHSAKDPKGSSTARSTGGSGKADGGGKADN